MLKWKNEIVEEIELPNHTDVFVNYFLDGYLWLFPRKTKDKILKIQMESGMIEEIDFPFVVYDVDKDVQTGDMLWNTRGGIARVNPITNTVDRIEYKVKGCETPGQIFELWKGKSEFRVGEQEGNPEYNTLSEYIKRIEKEDI